ncbi:MAG: PilT/PilU family type 4a pilus ATPase [Myxococcota bacterium]|nr:PilT/PilU family type 4a pilus ATPase [Myxococcota bacterium]
METLPIVDYQQIIVPVLGACPLFEGLELIHIDEVARHGSLHRFKRGELIARQGEPSNEFFIFIEGRAVIRLGSDQSEQIDVAHVSPPESVGEMGVLLEDLRTASVAIESETALVVRYSSQQFARMLKNLPHFSAVMCKTLAKRLSQTNRQMGLTELAPFVDEPNPAVFRLLPSEFQVRHRAVPLQMDEQTVTVGYCDGPSEHLLRRTQRHFPSLIVRPARITQDVFDDLLRKNATGNLVISPDNFSIGQSRERMLDSLLKRAVGEGASDLHLSASQRPRWRIDGRLNMIQDLGVLTSTQIKSLVMPLMDAVHRTEFAETNDTDFAYQLDDDARFRINVFRDRHGVSAVFRHIPSHILTLEQLGLPPVIAEFCSLPNGLVLVTGPTGSGKSTSLAAMVDYINRRREEHIITLEDPIEFVHRSQKCLINQREIGAHTGSFAKALRAALREDPDIVLVGEMRDLETISLALETAQTGHLVFATLHTSTAIGTVERIIGMYPPEQQQQIRSTLGEVLRGVLAQTLLRKQTGGRIGAFEVLVSSFAVANLIRDAKTQQIMSLMETGRQKGNRLLNVELTRLVRDGTVSFDEAYRRASDKNDFRKRAGRAGRSD